MLSECATGWIHHSTVVAFAGVEAALELFVAWLQERGMSRSEDGALVGLLGVRQRFDRTDVRTLLPGPG
jgi:hypothetical protein